MATGGSDSWYRNVPNSYRSDTNLKFQVCRYFLHGACTKGQNCRYSHDKSRTVPVDNVCRYYLAGNCHYGSRCRYDHVKSRTMPEPWHNTKTEGDSNVTNVKSNMVKLTKGGIDKSVELAKKEQDRESFEKKWVTAKDFVPGQKYHGSVPGSYAKAVHQVEGAEASGGFDPNLPPIKLTDKDLLCPYYSQGYCPQADTCPYIHGDLCDMCGLSVLHPTNEVLREQHLKECLEEHTKEMEYAFLMKGSSEKECGICLEVVREKSGEPGMAADRRFGILENCSHCFCLTCIKEWRSKRVAEKKTHRSCPVCRTHSNFVTPSAIWVESPEEKKKLIADYLAVMGTKPCQYFKQGMGECPFYDKCFYLHALPDGTKAPPQPRPKRRRRTDRWGEDSLMEEFDLWDFFISREEGALSLDDELSLLWLDAFNSDDDSDDGAPFGLSWRLNFGHDDFIFTDSSDSDSDVPDLV